MKTTVFLSILSPLLTVPATGTLLVLCLNGAGATTQVQSTAVHLDSLQPKHRHDSRTPGNSLMAADQESGVVPTKEGSARPLAYRRPSTSGSRTGSMLSTVALLGLLGAGISALLSVGSASKGHQSSGQLASTMSPVAGLPTKALNKLVVGAGVLALVLLTKQLTAEEVSDTTGLGREKDGGSEGRVTVSITINNRQRELVFPEVVKKALEEKQMLNKVMEHMGRTPQLVSSGNKFRLQWGSGDDRTQKGFSTSLTEKLDADVYLPPDAEACFWDGEKRNEAGKEWERVLREFFTSRSTAQPTIPRGEVIEKGDAVTPPVRRVKRDGKTIYVIGSGWKQERGSTQFKDGQSFVRFDFDDEVRVKMLLNKENEDLWRGKGQLRNLQHALNVKPELPASGVAGQWFKRGFADIWLIRGKSEVYAVHLPVTQADMYPDGCTEWTCKDFKALLKKTIQVFEDLSAGKRP